LDSCCDSSNCGRHPHGKSMYCKAGIWSYSCDTRSSEETESQVGAEVSALDEVEVGTSNKVCSKKTGSSCPSGYWQETVGTNIQKTYCCRRRTEEVCTDGILEGGVCCAASCGTCGGYGCDLRKGGGQSCCVGTIKAANRMCKDATDTVCVIPHKGELDLQHIGQGYCSNYRELSRTNSKEECYHHALESGACAGAKDLVISYGKGSRRKRCLCNTGETCRLIQQRLGRNGYDSYRNRGTYNEKAVTGETANEAAVGFTDDWWAGNPFTEEMATEEMEVGNRGGAHHGPCFDWEKKKWDCNELMLPFGGVYCSCDTESSLAVSRAPASNVNVLVQVFAFVGFGSVVYGAFKHYCK